jgi:uncharacterized membrane protein YbhN (UPF0104 family)
MVAFVLVGAASAFFLPVPGWAKITMLVGLPLAAGGLVVASLVHHRFGHRLPKGVGAFLAGAAAPKRVMLRAGLILVLTWVARWFGILFLLHAVGVHVGVGSALLYMVVTGLANTMPFLPGNVGLYQGAALGALAMAGHGGTSAAAASVFTPAAGGDDRARVLWPSSRRAAPRRRSLLAELRRVRGSAVAADVAVLRADDQHHERFVAYGRDLPRRRRLDVAEAARSELA